MGYMRHHAIIVTSWNEDALEKAQKKALDLGMATTNLAYSSTNGYVSFLVAPDGSKEGWVNSDEGDLARDAFIEWLSRQGYDDGSSSLDWIEVQYGDEVGIQGGVRASDCRYPVIPRVDV